MVHSVNGRYGSINLPSKDLARCMGDLGEVGVEDTTTCEERRLAMWAGVTSGTRPIFAQSAAPAQSHPQSP